MTRDTIVVSAIVGVSLVVSLFFVISLLDFNETPDILYSKVVPGTKITVLAFVAPWCEPCNRAKLSLSVIRKAGVSVWIIDIDKTPDFAIAHKITSVPTFLVYVEGKRTTRTQDISVVVRIVKENMR